MIGTQVANYRIEKKLGQGGMGMVYKAIDVNLDRMVALKFLSTELSNDPGLIERFRLEARSQATLNHTNIATLYNFFNVDGNWVIVMEYVDGENLEQLIQRSGVMRYEDAVPLFKQALLGVGFAHRNGIVHRDIKPANIMINRHGIVKVMDFGIAKALTGTRLTRTGVAVGTVSYMPPEQIRNQTVDIRSDIYSLGITLYQMLTAHLPFESESDFQVQFDHVHTPPPPLSLHYPYLPRGIEAAVLKALEKEPSRRFRTVEEFGAALEHPDVVPAEALTVGVSESKPATVTPPVSVQPAPLPATAVQPAGKSVSGVEPAQQSTAGSNAPMSSSFLTARNGMIAAVVALVLVIGIGVAIWKKPAAPEKQPVAKGSSDVSGGGTNAPPIAHPSPPSEPQARPTPPPVTPPSIAEQVEQERQKTLSQKAQKAQKEKQAALQREILQKEAVQKAALKKQTPPPAPPPPVVDPGTAALQRAQTMFERQQLLTPANNCALYWARQAAAHGNRQGSEIEKGIQQLVRSQFDSYLQARNYPQAMNLITEMEHFYPGRLNSWRNQLQAAQQR